MSGKNCKTCLFGHFEGQNHQGVEIGECRVAPPKSYPVMGPPKIQGGAPQMGMQTVSPVVREDHWCGAHVPAINGEARGHVAKS